MSTGLLCMRTAGGIRAWLPGLMLLTMMAMACGNDSVMLPEDEGYRISGQLMETDNGIAGANVIIVGPVGASTVTTDELGYFSAVAADSGEYLIVPVGIGGHRFSPDTVVLGSVVADTNAGIFTLMSGFTEITMTALPSGDFQMGSAGGEADETPHVVALSSFLIGTTEITWAQYFAVTGESPVHFRGNDLRPVEGVSWQDAADFCNALSLIKNLEPCYGSGESCDYSKNGYRLPTEAEWEYACRAGSVTQYFFGDSDTLLDQHAQFSPYGASSGRSPLAWGSLVPNQWGLFDILGNVAEWCNDWYGPYPADTDDVSLNPTGPEDGVFKVVRGGSWRYPASGLRSANRDYRDPLGKYSDVGFRVVRRYD